MEWPLTSYGLIISSRIHFPPTIEISDAEHVGSISRLPVIDSSNISQLGLCPIIISVRPSSILSTMESNVGREAWYSSPLMDFGISEN